jgi:hypothetical protein
MELLSSPGSGQPQIARAVSATSRSLANRSSALSSMASIE